MATYVNDLRLKEIATGDESGTWGTSTNTNLELIGEALGYGTQDCFSSDADATTTVADGATDPARAMYFKVTSSATLSATRTLTMAPNTISRVMFIENATTGSQSIAISQGSGANVTIATGKTAVVYLDGAGSGAAVVDAMALVDPGVTDTLAEVLTAGNSSSGTNIELTTTDKVQFRDSAIYINSSADGQLDLVADTEIQIAATTIDIDGNADISGTALVGTSVTTPFISLGSTSNSYQTVTGSSDGNDLTYRAFQNHIFKTATGASSSTDGTERLRIDSNGKLLIGDSASHTDDLLQIETPASGGGHGIQIRRNDANGDQQIGTITFGNNTDTDLARISAKTDGDGNSGDSGALLFSTQVTSGALTERMRIDSSGKVGIGTTSPDSTLHVHTASAGSVTALSGTNLTVEGNANNYLSFLSPDANLSALVYGSPSSTNNASINSSYNSGSPYLNFNTGGSEAMRIDSSGNLLVGKTSESYTTVGAELRDHGTVGGTTTTQTPFFANRTTDDGALFEFYRNTTAVGAIGSHLSRIHVSAGDAGLFVDGGGTPAIWPWKSTATTSGGADAEVGLGDSSNRFKDLYLSGTVNAGKASITTAADFGLELDTGTAGDGILKIGHFSNGAFIGTYNDDGGAADILRFGTHSGDERMRIDSSGNVGIGTTPASELHVKGATPDLRVENTTASETVSLSLIKTATKGFSINNKAISGTNYLTFNLDTAGAGTEAMTIDGTSGNVSVSSSGGLVENATGVFMLPTGELRVKDNTEDGTSQISIYNNNTTNDSEQFFVAMNLGNVEMGNRRTGYLGFKTNNSEAARIDSSGNVGIGGTPTTILDVFGKQRIFLNNTSTGNASSLQLTQDGTGDAAISFLMGVTTEWLAGVDNSDSDSFKISNITGGGDFTSTGMTLTTAGNAGIGTTSPSSRLTVSGAFDATSAGSKPSITGAGNYGGGIGFIDTNVSGIYTDTSGANLNFFTNQSSSDTAASKVAMTIDGTGEITFKANAGSVSHVFAYNEDGGEIKLADNTGATGTLIDQSLNSTRVLELINGSNLAIGLGASNTTGNVIFYGAGFSEAARIDSSGNLLVGLTSNPDALIHAQAPKSTYTDYATVFAGGTDSNNAQHGISLSSAGNSLAGIVGSNVSIDGTTFSQPTTARSSGYFTFLNTTTAGDTSILTYSGFTKGTTTAVERFRMDGDGNFQVGQTVGTLFGQTAANGVSLGGTGAIQAACATTVLFLNRLDASGGQVVRFDTNGTQVGSISTTSSATAYNTSSDQRLKENIVDAPSASDDIDAIQVRSFDWKADGSHQKYGMVAQELVTVAPSAVSQPEDPEEMMSVDYSKLVPMMLKEIQQLRARVAQLEGDN